MVERVREQARRLAELLARGHSLEEAARMLGVSPARARLLLTFLDDFEPKAGCSMACESCPLQGVCRLRRVRLVRIQ